MVGNSLKSDILPVVAIGGQAVHIPYHITWSHEVIADADSRQQGYVTLEHIGLLPDLVEQMQHR
jgi:putative hydrolase of the HAD superfamily